MASSSTVHSSNYVMLSTSFVQSQIDFGLQQMKTVRKIIAHYKVHVADYRLLLDVGVHSGQKKRKRLLILMLKLKKNE